MSRADSTADAVATDPHHRDAAVTTGRYSQDQMTGAERDAGGVWGEVAPLPGHNPTTQETPWLTQGFANSASLPVRLGQR